MEISYLIRRPRLYEEFLPYETVQRWTQGLKEGTGKRTALYHFARFMQFLKQNKIEKSPDDLINECLDGNNRTLIMHLDWVKRFVEGDSLSGVGYAGRYRVYISVRGFYSNNRVSLPREKVRFRDTEAVTYKAEGNIMLDDLRKAVGHKGCSTRDRAVILCMSQSGMDDSTLSEIFNFVGYPQLVKHFGTEDYSSWSLDKCPVKIDLVRPKTAHRYYSFLDRDAISSLKDWLNVRRTLMGNNIKIYEKEGPNKLPRSDPIFVVKGRIPIRAYLISKTFLDVGISAGINVRPPGKLALYRGASRRYPFHSHEMRDLLKSLAHLQGVDDKASEFFLGHKMDAQGYNKSPFKDLEYFRDQYSKMSSYLNVLTPGPTPRAPNAEMEEMKEELATLKSNYQKMERWQKVTEELMIKYGTKSGDLKEIDLKDLFTAPPGYKIRKKK